MKKLVTIYLLLLFCSLPILAQDATNVRVRQERESIVITYDLAKQSNVRVFVATGQSNQYAELKAVTGAVGKDILAGDNLQITWQPLKEQMEFVAQNVRFKIETIGQYFFSVGPNKKVVFSQGNLQYQPSTKTWRFAEHQYDYIGEMNKNISNASYTGWIDLFGWSTNNRSISFGISASENDEDYEGPFVDWGINSIEQYGNIWYTLSADEWFYLFFDRKNAGKLFAFGSVDSVEGVIILPDKWVALDYIPFTPSTEKGLGEHSITTTTTSPTEHIQKERDGFYQDDGDSFSNTVQSHCTDNVYTAEQWHELEWYGATFLPIAGFRGGEDTNILFRALQKRSIYWSSTGDGNSAYGLEMGLCIYLKPRNKVPRKYGFSVRLVRDYNNVIHIKE